MDADEVTAQLNRILAFGDLQSSGQMSRFLTFVVEEALAGRASQIKERTIAIGALDRDGDFDPRIDPIVRVVAGKLRRTLERYELSAGAADDLRIDIPKGSYVPRFTPRSGSPPDESIATAARSSESILRTKLHAPPVTPDFVRPTALLERLNRHRHLPFTLVSAPAGYGKSTLLSAWLDECSVPGAWLSLDEDDNDLREFLGGFVAAVRTVFPAVGEATRTLLAAPDLPPVRVLCRQLLNDLDDTNDAFVLVLDDYHVIHQQAVHDLLAELLRHPPRTLHLAVLTRQDLPLPLDRLRGRGQVEELSMFDLRFTPAETVEFLGRTLDAPLGDTAVRAIVERMEGWPAGLRLLAQSLRHQEDPQHAIGELRGDVDAVTSYLVSEVLSHFPPMTATSLLRMSIPDRFSGPLCDVLCDQDLEPAKSERDGRSLIAWLRERNLFLVSLDAESRWFRFHHLFQSLLKDRLEQRCTTEEIAALHARASAWFASQGLIDEAIDHALQAGDPGGAADILARNRYAVLNSDRWYDLHKWLGRLPEAVAQRRAGILLAKAWIAYQHLWIADIPPLLHRVEALIDDDETGEALRGEIDYFSGVVAFWQGEGELGVAHAEKALQKLPAQFEAARADAEIYLGLSRQMCGQQELALRCLQERVHENISQRGIVLTRQLATISFIHLIAGQLPQAIRAAEQFRTVSRQSDYLYTDLWASYLEGSCHLQIHNLEEAAEQLGRVARNRYLFHPSTAMDCLAGLAVAYQAMQRAVDAQEAERELLEFAGESGDVLKMAIAESCRARLALLRGDRDSAERWLRGYDVPLDAPSMIFFLEVPFLTQCRVLVAGGTKAALDEAISELDRARDALRSLHNNFQSIEVGVLRALALQGLSRDDEALSTLENTVALAAPGGWVRPFAEPGRPMIDLLSRLVERDSGGAYARGLLATLRDLESGVVHCTSDVEEKRGGLA